MGLALQMRRKKYAQASIALRLPIPRDPVMLKEGGKKFVTYRRGVSFVCVCM